jgi:hypothetical protein
MNQVMTYGKCCGEECEYNGSSSYDGSYMHTA